MSNEERFDTMLFNYETTGRTDFRDGEIKIPIKTTYQPKPVCVGVRPPPLKYIHTAMDWKIPNVPIGLYTWHKDIVQTDPRILQPPFSKTPDLELESVRQTRPRVIMTPAVSLDDVEEVQRNMILKDTYTTSAQKAMHEVASMSTAKSVVSPLVGKYAKTNPLSLAKPQPPFVSPEWRMDSAAWDQRQRRTYCHPTREFWLSRPTN